MARLFSSEKQSFVDFVNFEDEKFVSLQKVAIEQGLSVNEDVRALGLRRQQPEHVQDLSGHGPQGLLSKEMKAPLYHMILGTGNRYGK